MRSRPALSLALAASLSLGSGGVAPPALASSPGELTIKVGQADAFTRIEFYGAQPRSAQRVGDDLILRFAAIASPDVSLLEASPPKHLLGAVVASVDGATELRLTLAKGTDTKLGRADGATYLNLSAAPAATSPPPDQTPERTRDPAPVTGAISMRAELQGGQVLLRFPWKSPLGAALFRRGEAIWLVFDARARIDLAEAPHGLPQVGRMEQLAAEHASVIRIVAPPSTLASLTAEANTWVLALGSSVSAPPAPVELGPDTSVAPPGLSVKMAGATGVFWLQDPMVGDRVAVVTALSPAKGNPSRRQFIDATVLASNQGLAIEPRVEDLSVTTDGDLVRIGRPAGLKLSVAASESRDLASSTEGLPQPSAMPALIDFAAWSKTGPAGFLARYDQLLAAMSEEVGTGAGVQARLGMARFLVGSELAFEAVGVLDLLAKTKPALLQNAEFRGLRGAARAMAGRYKEAEADFSSPLVAEDPASALWRGYSLGKLGDTVGARQQFAKGRTALALFPAKWKARFARADAEAALASNDLGPARADLLMIGPDPLDAVEIQAVQLDRARLLEAGGRPDEALGLYTQVSTSDYGALAAPALLHLTQIELAQGKLKPADAVATLDSLRFRWRGDATELETVRALGTIYLSQGRSRDALEALRSAAHNLSQLPGTAAVQADLATAFHGLFLDGGADGLPPIQALGLFLDFKDLTPIGADGDMMVRRLARRLVDVDLLDEAGQLLKYQADNRLEGVGKAEVDTDLALIELMNKKPEAALAALNDSRTTLLPKDLSERRRILQARALSALGRADDASELLETDASVDATDVKADIAWRQRNWGRAGALLEAELGERWKSSLPIAGLDQARLLRAGVAYSLAADDTGLTRLRSHYSKLAEGGTAAAALRVALSGVDSGPYSAADYVRAVSDTDAFTGWVAAMKAKYLSTPGAMAGAAAPGAAVKG